MANKIEKSIIAFYLIQIVLCVYFFFQIFFIQGSLGLSTYNTIFLALLFTPIFFVLMFIYRKKHIVNINKNSINKLTRNLKISAWILFSIALIVFVVSANFIDKNLEKINPDMYAGQINMSYLVIRDLIGLIWPIILILFAINFYRKTDVNQRYQNLKNATWAMFIFGFLISFHKTIGSLIFDIEQLIQKLLK